MRVFIEKCCGAIVSSITLGCRHLEEEEEQKSKRKIFKRIYLNV